jgi:hypothetical protein
MKEELIAPCGMNCAVCSSYLAQKYAVKEQGIKISACAGCRPRNKQCAFLKKSCSWLGSGKLLFCYQCPDFPCRKLNSIDERYKTRYRMSMVANLIDIREQGMAAFLEKEKNRWLCPRCGGEICCHNGLCYRCDLDSLRNKKKKYRWED